VALMFHFGVAGIYTQPRHVDMMLSDTAAASTINLRPGTPTSEYDLAGNGTLGQPQKQIPHKEAYENHNEI
jgi:hypothetical protein